MSFERVIAVGDVHGCLDELTELLDQVRYDSTVDRLIFVGDLVDRGPKSVEVVRMVRQLGAEATLGNHEEKHVRYALYEEERLRTGKRNPMRPFEGERMTEHNALSPADRAFLASMPPFIRFEAGAKKFIVTHAGVASNKPIEEQDYRKLVRIRHVDIDTGSYTSGSNPRIVPPNSMPWTQAWKGPENVIYGHDVASRVYPKLTNPVGDVWCYGIDTGCCFGGRLTAALVALHDGDVTFVQIQARREYYKNDRTDD